MGLPSGTETSLLAKLETAAKKLDGNPAGCNALAAFVKAMGLYPPGNRVRLSDGSQGTVIAVGQDTIPRLDHRHIAPGPGRRLADL